MKIRKTDNHSFPKDSLTYINEDRSFSEKELLEEFKWLSDIGVPVVLSDIDEERKIVYIDHAQAW